jgi:hypothetical protein
LLNYEKSPNFLFPWATSPPDWSRLGWLRITGPFLLKFCFVVVHLQLLVLKITSRYLGVFYLAVPFLLN